MEALDQDTSPPDGIDLLDTFEDTPKGETPIYEDSTITVTPVHPVSPHPSPHPSPHLSQNYHDVLKEYQKNCPPSVKLISTAPFVGVEDPLPGFGKITPFIIYQQKPLTSQPLHVWRGYHGNVYFQPLKINSANLEKPQMQVRLPPLQQCSPEFQKVVYKSRWNPEHVLEYRQKCLDNLDQALFHKKLKHPKQNSLTPCIQLDPSLSTKLQSGLETQIIKSTRSIGTLKLIDKTQSAKQLNLRGTPHSSSGRLMKGFTCRSPRSQQQQRNPDPQKLQIMFIEARH